MSGYEFRPAARDGVGLFVGLAGGTASGKTLSALMMAQGIVGHSNKFAVVDTENGRAKHYAPVPSAEPNFIDTFRFDVVELAAPFNPKKYEDAVKAAYDSGYKAIVVDSASHEHDGEGGYLDMQSDDLQARVDRYMKKYPNSKEWEVVEKLTPSSWIAPKRERKRMMQTLLACSTTVPIIFCFRAEEKVFGTKDGKLVAHNPPIWAPVCGKQMPFEMTVFFLLKRERPGYPEPIKLLKQHAALFPLDKPITEESGRLIAEWAAGGSPKAVDAQTSGSASPGRAASSPPGATSASSAATGDGPVFITENETLALIARCDENGIDVARLKKAAGVADLAKIESKDLARAQNWISAAIAAKAQAA